VASQLERLKATVDGAAFDAAEIEQLDRAATRVTEVLVQQRTSDKSST